jgi:hypothetical protein
VGVVVGAGKVVGGSVGGVVSGGSVVGTVTEVVGVVTRGRVVVVGTVVDGEVVVVALGAVVVGRATVVVVALTLEMADTDRTGRSFHPMATPIPTADTNSAVSRPTTILVRFIE